VENKIPLSSIKKVQYFKNINVEVYGEGIVISAALFWFKIDLALSSPCNLP